MLADRRRVRQVEGKAMTTSKAVGLALEWLAASGLFAGPTMAQDWPTKPVRVVVPFGAGGAADRLGRLAADHLTKAFKQQFYIENRVGAGGAVASTQVARAEADGYTLLIGGSGPHIMGPAENPNIGYDPVGDFTHIAMIGGESFALSAQASLGVKSFKELIALSKSRAEPLNCGSPGAGSLGQLMVEQMRLRNIANLNHVPYRGGAPLLTDFFGNHIPVAATPILPILQHAAAGTVVPLGVTSTERIPLLKDVPTFAELGFPEMNGAIWFWLAGPKNLPAPIVEKLNQEVRRYINAPETRKQFETSALLSMDASVPTLTNYVAGELKRWTAFVEEKGLKK
jgi:tripartite-type tricarboxylate transporter receptor subunit TctC